jgi:NADPH2:quinone reductase
MATQTALALTEIGKPLTKITLPIPESKKLGENEIIIKITATGREFHYPY